MHAVITGSSRGIGFALVQKFLDLGFTVTVSGSSGASTEIAVNQLSHKYHPDRLHGVACDVRKKADILYLWDKACEKFGAVDVWINNAGIADPRKLLKDYSSEEADNIVRINLLGSLYGMQAAFNGMKKQGFGQIFNMEGFGSDGMMSPFMNLYGTTKYAIRHLTRAFYRENRHPLIVIGTLSPGMVATDLLLKKDSGEVLDKKTIALFNILADKPETVAAFLVRKIHASRKKNPHIAWLTGRKVFWRFFSSIFRKRHIVE
jgi:NAD(P)-dependent dehydrogenase (short-subunit alcohol dehydrogenase family)